ncbi:unnamed protein product [Schistocephalus solidus]|uniref:Uncharacterized protein n=1 Tax=Schistocephalus solidus TaxID=70667 RepID=A0A183TNV0_SCHSO|nr:unnamed protein product [Schistocephalus solidus]
MQMSARNSQGRGNSVSKSSALLFEDVGTRSPSSLADSKWYQYAVPKPSQQSHTLRAFDVETALTANPTPPSAYRSNAPKTPTPACRRRGNDE